MVKVRQIHLRQQFLEIVSAAEWVEVWLLEFVGLAPTGLDSVAEGGDGLVRERRRLGRGHAGLRFGAQSDKQGQRLRMRKRGDTRDSFSNDRRIGG